MRRMGRSSFAIGTPGRVSSWTTWQGQHGGGIGSRANSKDPSFGSPQPENVEGPVDCEPRHGKGQDEKDDFLYLMFFSEKAVLEGGQSRCRPSSPGAVSGNSIQPPGPIPAGPGNPDPLIPHSNDSLERPMGHMGSFVASLQGAVAYGPRAPGRTQYGPPTWGRLDVTESPDPVPVLLNCEFHGHSGSGMSGEEGPVRGDTPSWPRRPLIPIMPLRSGTGQEKELGCSQSKGKV